MRANDASTDKTRADETWTDDRIASLKQMWADGATAAAIAERLGGLSRSAVLGKIHRLRPSVAKKKVYEECCEENKCCEEKTSRRENIAQANRVRALPPHAAASRRLRSRERMNHSSPARACSNSPTTRAGGRTAIPARRAFSFAESRAPISKAANRIAFPTRGALTAARRLRRQRTSRPSSRFGIHPR